MHIHISYNVVEGLETELTFNAIRDQQKLLEGMSPSSEMATGVAFANYDIFVEALSGKDTIHHTVGIAYQLVEGHNSEVDFNVDRLTLNRNSTSEVRVERKRRRRTYEVIVDNIEPYHKNPRMTASSFLPLDYPRRSFVPESLKKGQENDFLWVSNLTLSSPKDQVPM